MGNPLEYLAGRLTAGDQYVMNAAANNAAAMQDARRKALENRASQRLEGYGKRDDGSMGSDVGSMYARLLKQKEPAGEDLVVREILNRAAQAAAAKAGVEDVAKLDKRLVYGATQGDDRQKVLEFLAKQGGPGPVAALYDAGIAGSKLLQDPTLAGQLARAGLYSGMGAGTVAGTTAGAQGILALIDYLQGNGAEPVA